MSESVRILSGSQVTGAENAIQGLLWNLKTSQSPKTSTFFPTNSASAYRFETKSAKSPIENVDTKTRGLWYFMLAGLVSNRISGS